MFGFKLSLKCAAAALAILLVGNATVAQSQTTRRTRRESNANRQARIARTIQETYSHRWEVAGGGGYLRFRTGEHLQRSNQALWFGSATYNLSPKLGIIADARGAYGTAKIDNLSSV